MHRRREKTHVGNELAPDGPNALNQIAVFTFVHHGNEAIGQLQTQGLHHRHIGPAQLLPASFIRVLRCRAAFNVGRLAPDHVSQARKQNRKHQKRAVRHTRQYTQHRQDPRGNEQRTLIGVHLLGQLLRKIIFRGHARDQNTCRSRNNERRHLRHQTIANGERAVNRERFAKAQVVIQDARDQTANQVDDQNQNARHRIAAHKLRSTVHRTKKVSLLRHLLTPLLGLLLLYQARIHIGINGHLLARHRVQSKARRHLGHTSRTLGNDHKIDDGDQDKNDHPHREIATNEELPKRLNHLARGIGARVTIEQHNARGRHIERQTHERGEQQQGGKRDEIFEVFDVQSGNENHDGHANVEREKQV